MELDRLLSKGLTVGVPLAVLLLLCGCGYLIAKRGRPELIDSPWFWILAFSAVGSLGLWAISGKYDDRQKRVEARYEARQRIAEQRNHASSGPAAEQFDVQPSERVDDAATLRVGYSPERRVPLRFLAAALLIVCAVSAVMLWRAGCALSRETPT